MLFSAALRPVVARRAITAAAAPQRRLASSSTSSANTSVFARENFAKYRPDIKFTGETTLGEVWEKCYVKYRYRLVYPIVAWVGFLYYKMWHPYTPESEKKKLKAREDYLASLEYHSV
ncbi:hypothetical protein HDU86_008097 [Geranomyces michiganensis]|nr:hypothetical protein HDU86_008097 [Geranomyces michiganensis]